MEKINAELYVVYDEFTEAHATNLFNKLSGKYTVAIWTDKNYNEHRNALSNNNRVLFLNEKLAKKTFLPHNFSKETIIAKGVSMLSNGNLHGIVVNSSVDDDEAYSDESGNRIEKPKFDRPWLRRLGYLIDPVGGVVLDQTANYGYKKAEKSYVLYAKAIDYLCKGDNMNLIIPE